ncbi:MAG: CHRD domain-containing protein [Gammaproteobacteria bacterium]|nr:CHRD domain-containing protein [Gammaproteobacteria bacterium]
MKAVHPYLRRIPTRFISLAVVGLALTGCLSDSKDDKTPPPDRVDVQTTPTPTPIAPISRAAILTGAQEQVPVVTNATGYASVVVDPATRGITGSVTFTGMTATVAHIHPGVAGTSGAPVVALTVDNATHSATIPAGTVLTQAQYDDLLAGKFYFNVHSSTNSGGEIRGQIGRVVMKATLTGAQETPTAVTTTATGTAMVVVDPITRDISGSVSTTGIVGTAAHIHTGAVGVGGAPAVALTVGTDSATVPANTVLTQTQYDNLLAGKLYVNVHSTTNPGGEIRGQIGPVAMVATLSGAQEVPAVTTTASGKAVFAVDPVTRELSGGVGYTGLSATVAHIHTGAAGVSGPPAVTLRVDGNTSTATVPAGTVLTQAQYDALLTGGLYVNVHSTTFGAGEIRGQVVAP